VSKQVLHIETVPEQMRKNDAILDCWSIKVYNQRPDNVMLRQLTKYYIVCEMVKPWPLWHSLSAVWWVSEIRMSVDVVVRMRSWYSAFCSFTSFHLLCHHIYCLSLLHSLAVAWKLSFYLLHKIFHLNHFTLTCRLTLCILACDSTVEFDYML